MERGEFEVPLIQNGIYSVFNPRRLASDTDYQISLYYDLETALKNKPNMILSAKINDLPLFANQFRCIVSKIAKTPDGFIVQISSGSPTAVNRGSLTLYRHWDYYDSQGVFQKRVAKDENELIPSKNSSDVFELQAREEDSFLVKLY